ncbi:MAG: hypothetical protein CBC13_10830 [Planctomycetia bacterium TMED53]|nr:MAG: hypothetical protein CBC13_10830 [Planctomycetia bacterium TMED53]
MPQVRGFHQKKGSRYEHAGNGRSAHKRFCPRIRVNIISKPCFNRANFRRLLAQRSVCFKWLPALTFFVVVSRKHRSAQALIIEFKLWLEIQ